MNKIKAGQKNYSCIRISKMRYLLLLVFFLCIGILIAQNQSSSELRQQMAQIRKTTNWSDPVKAKEANEKIQALSKQLILNGNSANIQAGKSNGNEPGSSANQQVIEDNVEYRMKLWKQMMKIVNAGKGAAMDLATPLREEIVQEYLDDETPKIKNPEFSQEINVLILNLSLKGIQVTIDQMPDFKSVKTLVIKCDGMGMPVNLPEILGNASAYPLEELYIINFRNFVTSVPALVGNFKDLTTLALFSNDIRDLPKSVASLSKLRTLYVDQNPISSLLPVIGACKNLQLLGVVNTHITPTECTAISKVLPQCKILQ
jgi:Leucine-rich repeat (LRR) protein